MNRAISSALVDSSLAGQVVCLHTRLSSFGWISAGPAAVVDAFVELGCTLVVPTFSGSFAAPRPPGRTLSTNAEDDGSLPRFSPDRGFATWSRTVDADMGMVPREVLHRADAVRGDHPLVSFTALGPLARDLVGAQRPTDPFAPLEAVVAHRGHVLAAGCALTSVSLLHLVRHHAGVRPFRRWALDDDMVVREVATFGCARGFGAADRAASACEQRRDVGTSHWRLWPAADLLAATTAAAVATPDLLVCSPACPRCRDATAGGPVG